MSNNTRNILVTLCVIIFILTMIPVFAGAINYGVLAKEAFYVVVAIINILALIGSYVFSFWKTKEEKEQEKVQEKEAIEKDQEEEE